MSPGGRPTCPACGEVADAASARFCENCGAPFAGTGAAGALCRCGAPDPDADGHCRTCGVRIGRPSVRPALPALPDYEESVDARLALACDRGRRHGTNQDYGAVARRTDGTALLVVCDGVSTSDGAEAASRAAAEAARAAFLTGAATLPGLSLEEQARGCVAAAAAAVLALGPPGDGPDGGAATTVVLAVARDRMASVAWVGDSRAYRVAAGVPEEVLTRDDSWCTEAVDKGWMRYEEAARDARAHAITQWLGMDLREMDVHARPAALPPGSSLLLCSDGLWNDLDAPGRLGTAYTRAAPGGDNRAACRTLVALANEAGGRDNVTVAILTPE